MTIIRFIIVLACSAMLAGCGAIRVGPQATVPASARIRRVAPQQAERLYNIMVPLLRAMNNPLRPNEVHVGIIDDPQINAANAGSGNFYVTAGLLEKASNEQLRGIMAHEIAHEECVLGRHSARLLDENAFGPIVTVLNRPTRPFVARLNRPRRNRRLAIAERFPYSGLTTV